MKWWRWNVKKKPIYREKAYLEHEPKFEGINFASTLHRLVSSVIAHIVELVLILWRCCRRKNHKIHKYKYISIVKDQDSRETSPAGKDKWHLQSCTGAKVPEIEIWIWCQNTISKTKLTHSSASNTFFKPCASQWMEMFAKELPPSCEGSRL